MTRKTPLGISNQLTTPTTAFAAKPVVQVFATPSSESRLPVCPLNLGRSHVHSDGPVPRSNSPIARDWSKPASYVFHLAGRPKSPCSFSYCPFPIHEPFGVMSFPLAPRLAPSSKRLPLPTPLLYRRKPVHGATVGRRYPPFRSPCRSLSSFEDSRATRRPPLRRRHDDLNNSRFLIYTRGQAVLIHIACLSRQCST